MAIEPDHAGGLREPPWSPEAEQSLLGCLLLDNGCMQRVADLVAAISFFRFEHRLIFGAAAALLRERKPADVVTVFEALHASCAPEDFGGLGYLNALVQSVPGSSNARRYAEIVAERADQRAMIAAADEAASISWEPGPIDDKLDRWAQLVARMVRARKAPPGRGVRLNTLAELRDLQRAVRWLVKHVVPADSIGMLFGGSGTF